MKVEENMKNITYVLDSGSDFEQDFSSWFHFPVRIVPLNLIIDGTEYKDGVDISKVEFYTKMAEAKELPKTSQPSPQQFYDVFSEEIAKGNEVLCITLTSKLSGTYQSAVIAKEMLEEEKNKVHIVDSESVSAHLILLLKKADHLIMQGHDLEEIVLELEKVRSKVNILALLDTLENLKKGGRVSFTQATIGGLLNIKPLITLTDGLVQTIEKFRGRKKGLTNLAELLSSSTIKKDTLFVVHSFLDQERLKEELEFMPLSDFKEIVYLKLGSTIGTHAGANTLGFVFENE